jgi:diguanylate cyclase (GGDEF)-like protein/PAS domain S-box-containing protein
MITVPLPVNEDARLTALHQAHILDTEPEERFDRLTKLAAEICEVTCAIISFVTADSCWPKSQVGCAFDEVPRDDSFAGWVVAGTEPMVIPDALLDDRFKHNMLVTGESQIRLYAGVPLITRDGYAIGVLAVFDSQPRELELAQIKLLQHLANLVMGQLNLNGMAEALTVATTECDQLKTRLSLNEKLLHRVEQHGTLQANNIRTLKEKLQELETNSERYNLIASSSNDGIWDWDLKTDKVFFDERWRAIIGLETQDEFGDSMDEWMDRIHTEDLELFKTEIEATLTGWMPTFKNEHRLQHHDGSYRWILSRGMAARHEDGTVYRVAGSIIDITDSKGAEQQLLHNAFHDVLTGLPNRALFMDRLKRSLNRAKYRPDYLFAALFLDLDRFKVINDSLGHQVGDELLVGIARRLEKCMRPGDMIARLGGDEFAVIIDNLKTADDAIQAADRLHQEMTVPYLLSGREVYASASIGVALSQSHHENAQDFLRAADTAMYHAKSRGRGCVELFDTEMHARALGQLQIETDLRRALQRQEFRIFYQPIVSTESRQVRGFEALVRWEHPEQGLLSPIRFMQVAEETGLVVPLDQWVLRDSCRQLREWQQEFPMNPLLSVSVNLSGKQFAHPDLCDKVRAILDETGIIPLSVKLEITESSLVENPDAAAQILRQLKELGVRISLDDFGTGYSSLSYLHRFPIDVLKIDRSFVNRMSVSKNSEIVRTIITLAINLGMEVIAEGVETEEQVAQLASMHCDYVQGYLFSPPMQSSAVHELLAITYPKSQRPQVAQA